MRPVLDNTGDPLKAGLPRRSFLGVAATSLAGCTLSPTGGMSRKGGRRSLDLLDFGAVGDGRTDNGPALARALSAAARSHASLHVPPGTFTVEDTHVFRSGSPFVPPAGSTIHGEGSQSVLRFRRSCFASFYGLTIQHDDILFRDLVIEVDRSGGTWTAGACAVAPVKNLRFVRVTFRGLGGRAGHYGVMPLSADIDGLLFDHCRFEGLDFGYVKGTSDVSTQVNINVNDCTGRDCTEVLELNSPGLFFGVVTEGSPVVTGITGSEGEALDTTRLFSGLPVRNRRLPPGTTVVSVDSASQITLSAPAVAGAAGGRPCRFSAGGCRNGVVRNLRAKDIGQWAVGLANCENWQVEAYGEDIGYELVHIEDGSRNLNVVAGGARCNTQRGVVGSPGASNGMVHISTGSSDVAVRFATADLTKNLGGCPNALCIHAGGIMGTTGLEVDPKGIVVSGRVLLKAGTQAVVAYNSDIRFEDLELINVDPASLADPMMQLNGCMWSGSLRVRNPGALVAPHPLSTGRFDSVTVLD